MADKTSVVDSILNNTSRQQYKEVITAPPLSGPGSGVVPSNLPGVIEGAPIGPYRTDGGVCIDAPPDSWDFQWVTLNYSGVGAQAMLQDFYVQLRKPVRKLFMVGNNSPGGQALFIHFVPLKKFDAGVVQNIFGNEPWIPFPGGQNLHGIADGAAFGSALTDASFIKFCKPISKFFATIYNGAGAGPVQTNGWNITLLATDDIDIEYSNAL